MQRSSGLFGCCDKVFDVLTGIGLWVSRLAKRAGRRRDQARAQCAATERLHVRQRVAAQCLRARQRTVRTRLDALHAQCAHDLDLRLNPVWVTIH